MEGKLCNVHAIARQKLRKNAECQKRDYDTRLSANTYKPGDLVLLWDKSVIKGLSKKINPNIWRGPYIVTRKISDLIFEIKGNPQSRSKVVHHDRLKPYHGNILPDWCMKENFKIKHSTPPLKQRREVNNLTPKTELMRGTRQRIKHKPFQY